MLLVIPAKLDNQTAALKLAICDDIGDASYDNQRVAAALVDLLNQLQLEQLIYCQKNLTVTLRTRSHTIYGRRLPARFG